LLCGTGGHPNVGFTDLLALDGITLLETNKYGRGLLQNQKTNFSPRVGFAYQFDPKLVIRGGFGLFYNSFENQGYGPNIGENYPFVYNFSYGPKSTSGNTGVTNGVAPIGYGTPWSGCSSASAGGTYTLESGLSCVGFTPSAVNASGLGLQGLQFDFQTPRTISTNFTVQYSITHTLSATASYVFTQGTNLQTGIGSNNVSQIYDANQSTSDTIASGKNEIPWPDFSRGMSYHATVGGSDYNGLQTKLEEQMSNGLNFLLAYTYSKTTGDAGDLLNGGSTGGYRAPDVPGLGPRFDWGLADFDLRQVVHFSGGYELPFGKDKRWLNQGKVTDAVIGGWSAWWITTLQGGQPLNFGCHDGTAAGLGCNDIKTGNAQLGLKEDSAGALHWIGNPLAFTQPCQLGVSPASPAASSTTSPCLSLTGKDALGSEPGQIVGPGFHRLDFSLYKNIRFSERITAQFRSDFFNILNHPNFNAPNFSGNGVNGVSGSGDYTNANFGEIGSTRDNPYDPRQIQFALKLLF
jgi:hypothetical protein